MARAFYEDLVRPKENTAGSAEKDREAQAQQRPSRKRAASGLAAAETRGIAVVVLDALTRRQWIKEDELAKQLHLNPKLLRKTLKMLEEEMLVMREQRKEVGETCAQHSEDSEHRQ